MKAYRWRVVVLLFLASVINYLDRAAWSVAAPMISKDLDLGPEQLGFIFSAFFVGYMLFNVAGGLLVDRVGAWIDGSACTSSASTDTNAAFITRARRRRRACSPPIRTG